MSEARNSRQIGRSILAILAGLVAGAVLSIGTDLILHAAGIFPALDEPKKFTNGLFALATAYRTLYGVLGGYVAARLAPNRPMRHALVLGTLGLVVSMVGAIAMRDVGPAWYPWTLVVLSLPQCWAGGKIFITSAA
jgi:hypothetical protein